KGRKGSCQCTLSLFIGVLVAGVAVCIWASVPGVAADGIVVPDPSGAAVDLSFGNVWITGCTTDSIRSDINSSSVSASNSVCAAPSPYTSPVVLGASSSSALSNNEVHDHLRGLPLSALSSNDSHCKGINRSLKGGQLPHLQDHGLSDPGKVGRMRKHLEPVRKRTKQWVYLGLRGRSSVCWSCSPPVNLLLSELGLDTSNVDPPLGHDRTKASRLRMAHNRIVLGWHESAADEAKSEPESDVHVPLLNGSSCIHPPRGGARNHKSQPNLQVIKGLNNRQPLAPTPYKQYKTLLPRRECRGLGGSVNCSNQWYQRVSNTSGCLPSRSSKDSNFSSMMVRKPSPFYLFNILGGGTIRSDGVTKGAWVGTESVAQLDWCLPYLQKIEKKLKCKNTKVSADRLTDPVDESPNLFGDLSQARQRDWLNN
ncbi:hypothetical protein H5410_021491, partial [Solanum commersonii]